MSNSTFSSDGDNDTNAPNSLVSFLRSCKNDPREKYDIRETSNKMGFKQRRFYDVVNVLDTMECCPKLDNESFLWIGMNEVRQTIEKFSNSRGAFLVDYPISSVIPSTGNISIPRITEDFILTFIALEKKFLNIIDIAKYMSRNNDRIKTTRCKLYQVSVVLELSGIIRKTSNTSEFRLDDNYFISASSVMNQSSDPLSINTLLSRNPPFVNATIAKRRKDFERAVKRRTEQLSRK